MSNQLSFLTQLQATYSWFQPLCDLLARQAETQAWLVGGAVRDWLHAQRISADLDIVLTGCPAERVARQTADVLSGHFVPLDWAFGIHRVVLTVNPDNPDQLVYLDFADALEQDIVRDLGRRDLTVNAMAVDIRTGALLDPCQGEADLRHRYIRMVSEQNLTDDPLRLLRVFRFAAGLSTSATSAQIDPATLDAVEHHAGLLWNVAGERIQVEWLRLLSADDCFPAVQAMAGTGLLEVLMPELEPTRAIPANGFHHLGLFDHTLELVRQAERLFSTLPDPARGWLNQLVQPQVSRLGLVKLSCLLHDIGKPMTLDKKDDPVYGERLTFYGHEEQGAVLCRSWLERIRVSHEIKNRVEKLVRWHLYPCQFGPDSPRKSLLRFYRRMADDTPDILLLAMADRHSTQGPWLKPEELGIADAKLRWLLDTYYAEIPTLRQPRLLNGHDVMQLLNIPPGPHLRLILDALQEAQQLGDIQTAEDARHWLTQHAEQFIVN